MWVYTLTLNERVRASKIESDWEAEHNAAADTGVSVSPPYAVITCDPRASDYQSWADEQPYVESIEEEKELPNPSSGDWDPPYSVANGAVEYL